MSCLFIVDLHMSLSTNKNRILSVPVLFFWFNSYSFGSIFYDFIYGCMFLFNFENYVFLLLCMFLSVYSVWLCCSVYCWCVNVYCTTATGCQLSCSYQIYQLSHKSYSFTNIKCTHIYFTNFHTTWNTISFPRSPVPNFTTFHLVGAELRLSEGGRGGRTWRS